MTEDILFVLGIELSGDCAPCCPALMLSADGRVVRGSIPFARAATESALAWHATEGAVVPKHRTLQSVSLLSAERVIRPDRILRRATGLIGAPDRHAILKLQSSDGPVWIPALLLLSSVFARNGRLADLISQHGALDFVIRPGARSKEGSVRINVGRSIPMAQITDDELRLLAWLAVDKRARSSWDSVYQNAWSQRRLDWSLPDVALTAWAWGIEVAGGLLATQLRGVRLCVEHRIEQIVAVQGDRSRVVRGRADGDSVFSFGVPESAPPRFDGLPMIF